MFGIPNTGA